MYQVILVRADIPVSVSTSRSWPKTETQISFYLQMTLNFLSIINNSGGGTVSYLLRSLSLSRSLSHSRSLSRSRSRSRSTSHCRSLSSFSRSSRLLVRILSCFSITAFCMKKKMNLADKVADKVLMHILVPVHRLPLAFQASHGFQWSRGAVCPQSGRPDDDHCHEDPSKQSTPHTPEVFVVESWRLASSFCTHPARTKVMRLWSWSNGT